jgi:hypothetical protein
MPFCTVLSAARLRRWPHWQEDHVAWPSYGGRNSRLELAGVGWDYTQSVRIALLEMPHSHPVPTLHSFHVRKTPLRFLAHTCTNKREYDTNFLSKSWATRVEAQITFLSVPDV